MHRRILSVLLILIFNTLVFSQNVIIFNPGCRQYDTAGNCVACSNRFYKDKEGICQPVNNNCRTFNPENGACTSCYDGFAIIEDVCLPKLESDDFAGLSNCNQLGPNGTCKKCSSGYYFDSKRVCQRIPDTCADFNIQLGQCMGCYQGYALDEKKNCVVDIISINDLGCNKFENGKCTKCSVGFYFDLNKKCQPIPSSCQNFDTNLGRCKQCYNGYTLDVNSFCVESTPEKVDLGCAKFQNGVCTKCSFGFYFSKDGKCKAIPTTCSNYNTKTQKCLGCYPGYALDNNNECIVSIVTPSDLGCSKFQNGICTKCSTGFYFDKKKNCQVIPQTCSNFDTANEICRSCYQGYVLEKGKCVIGDPAQVSDTGCNSFQNGKCVKCSYGYYFDKQKNCKMIPPTCRDFDTNKQVCNSCYPGFALNDNRVCVEDVKGVTDLGCARFQNGKCTRCSVGFYFDRAQSCKPIPSTCSNFDTTRQQCRSCYQGYQLNPQKQCIQSKLSISDEGCSKFEQGKCIACSFGYYFNIKGSCQQIPTTCSDFNTLTQKCRACYPGYQLNSKSQCVVSQASAIDLNCKQFRNGKCIQCSFGAFFDQFGKCVVFDALCKKFNSRTKVCEECYPGFALDSARKVCVDAPAAAIDPNCRTFKNGQCAECSFRFFKDVDGKCKSVDPTCRLYNTQTGECNACYDGYKLANKKCEKDETAISDTNCAQWKNGKCTKCSYGSYFSNGVCKLVDPLCMTWSDITGQCRSCYPSFEVSNGKCIPSKNDKLDPNCAKFNKNECIQCSRGFYFNSNKICTQVDPLCAGFDSKTGQCFNCYTGYKIEQGKCLEDPQAVSDLACAQFKANTCVKCSNGFYFDEASRCRPISPQCKFFNNQTRKCGDCYPGYVLSKDQCIPGTKDNLCAETKQGICLRCVPRAYFNDQALCTLVSQYCKQYNPFDGYCQSCYGGFQLSKGQCIAQKQSNGCIEYSKDNKCQNCQKRRYLDNGKCLKIDDLCESFNYNKKECTKCYSGYSIVNGKCIVAQIKADTQISNCYVYNLDSKCVQCFDRYYLKDNTCVEVNVFCKKYHLGSGDCTDCYTGFKLSGAKCVRK